MSNSLIKELLEKAEDNVIERMQIFSLYAISEPDDLRELDIKTVLEEEFLSFFILNEDKDISEDLFNLLLTCGTDTAFKTLVKIYEENMKASFTKSKVADLMLTLTERHSDELLYLLNVALSKTDEFREFVYLSPIFLDFVQTCGIKCVKGKPTGKLLDICMNYLYYQFVSEFNASYSEVDLSRDQQLQILRDIVDNEDNILAAWLAMANVCSCMKDSILPQIVMLDALNCSFDLMDLNSIGDSEKRLTQFYKDGLLDEEILNIFFKKDVAKLTLDLI